MKAIHVHVNMILNNGLTRGLYCLCSHLSLTMNIHWISINEPRGYYRKRWRRSQCRHSTCINNYNL